MRRMVVWAALAAAAALIFPIVQGQQAYNENDQFGYLCSNNKTLTQCSTYLMYRAKYNDTLELLANRFQLSRQQIASASNIQDGQQLPADQLLLIPIPTCSCVQGRSQYNVTYVIQKGDTFYLVSLGTFEGLTTYQAVERANPSSVPTQLNPGDKIVFPLRCACPSSDQTAKGVQMLATYPIIASDTVASISRAWNVSTNDILSANELAQNSCTAEIVPSPCDAAGMLQTCVRIDCSSRFSSSKSIQESKILLNPSIPPGAEIQNGMIQRSNGRA